MAISRKDIERKFPAHAKRAIARQLDDTEGPLTKAVQLGREVGTGGKRGRIVHTRTWSDLWKRTFDSGLECQYADEVLWLRWKAGDISKPDFQVHVQLIPRDEHGRGGVALRVDFAYHDHHYGEYLYDEFKGKELQPWPTKKNIWKQLGPGRLLVHKYIRGEFVCTEDITPARPREGESNAGRD